MSLIELMIAVTLSLVVALAVTTLFNNNSVARKEIDSTGQQIENGRYAMELVRNDVRLAGYFGEFIPPPQGVTWQLPANPCDPTLANLGWNATGTKVPVPVSGFEGHDAAIAAMSPQCISNRVAESDVLVVRRVATSTVTPPTIANTAYLQVSLQTPLCPSTEPLFAFDTVHSPNPFTLRQRDCSTAQVARQYLVHIYYVSSCDDCGSSDGIPTLKRVELTANAMTTVSLAQGISDFRVDYGLDTDNDGFPDVYKKCGADSTYSGPCTVTDWANVVTVKYSARPQPRVEPGVRRQQDLHDGTVRRPARVQRCRAGVQAPPLCGPHSRHGPIRSTGDAVIARRRPHGSSTRRQRGVAVFFALIFMGLLTLLAVSAFNISSVNLKVVTNVQARQEATVAADQAAQQVISNSTFALSAVPYTTSIDVDINKDTLADYTASVVAAASRTGPTRARDRSSTPPTRAPVPDRRRVCHQTQWDVRSRTLPASAGSCRGNAGTDVTIHQGVSMVMSLDNAVVACP